MSKYICCAETIPGGFVAFEGYRRAADTVTFRSYFQDYIKKKGAFSMRIITGFQHGVNLGGWLSQCVATTDAHFNTFITEVDIERMSQRSLFDFAVKWIEKNRKG